MDLDLPLLLAGPILRRVEPNLVTVWLALSRDAKVTLAVYEGLVGAGTTTPFALGRPEQTWRLGEQAAPGARHGPPARDVRQGVRQPDTLYSYDVLIMTADETHTSGHARHAARRARGDVAGRDGARQARLRADLLPSFAPPPSELTDLRILYGSCRRPGHRDPDAWPGSTT